MIIACPACATRYAVPDSAIGVEGRTVRCAKCKHSWFQDGPEMAEPIAAAYANAPPAPTPRAAEPPRRPQSEPQVRPQPAPVETRAPVAASEPAPAPVPRVEQPRHDPVPPAWVDEDDDDVQEPVAGAVPAAPAAVPAPVDRAADEPAPAPAYDGDEDDYSQFDHGPPFRRRRNWLRWLTWGAGAFAALALAAVAAMSFLGTPSWLPIEKPLFGADPGLTVEFPPSEQERRTLPNGAEFFGARVVVKNPAREMKSVPPLLIVLRDARERVVYSWELVPPQRTLAPGEAMTINEAVTDVPKSAVYADIGWAPR